MVRSDRAEVVLAGCWPAPDLCLFDRTRTHILGDNIETMTGLKKLFVTASILVMGAICSLPFVRKADSTKPQSDLAADTQLNWRSPTASVPVDIQHSSSPQVLPAVPDPDARPQPHPQPRTEPRTEPRPESLPRFGEAVEVEQPAPSLEAESPTAKLLPRLPSNFESAAIEVHRPITPRQQPVEQPRVEQPVRQHIVVDGDTLENLAARFLGERERYLEIFEINQDVLAAPRPLPLGIKLKIPIEE